MYSYESLIRLNLPELKLMCKCHGLKCSGNKPDLVQRLLTVGSGTAVSHVQALQQSGPAASVSASASMPAVYPLTSSALSIGAAGYSASAADSTLCKREVAVGSVKAESMNTTSALYSGSSAMSNPYIPYNLQSRALSSVAATSAAPVCLIPHCVCPASVAGSSSSGSSLASHAALQHSASMPAATTASKSVYCTPTVSASSVTIRTKRKRKDPTTEPPQSGTSAPKAKAKKQAVEDEEKRRSRWSNHLSSSAEERLSRAFTHRLFLIDASYPSRAELSGAAGAAAAPAGDSSQLERTQSGGDSLALINSFTVLGNSGNVYTIKLGNPHRCTCPDFGNGNLCKHVLFVLHRVLKLDRNSPLLAQRALLRSELRDIFMVAPANSAGAARDGIIADDALRNEYMRRTGSASSVAATPAAAPGIMLSIVCIHDDSTAFVAPELSFFSHVAGVHWIVTFRHRGSQRVSSASPWTPRRLSLIHI